MEVIMLNLSVFSHNHHPSGVNLLAKYIRRGIWVILFIFSGCLPIPQNLVVTATPISLNQPKSVIPKLSVTFYPTPTPDIEKKQSFVRNWTELKIYEEIPTIFNLNWEEIIQIEKEWSSLNPVSSTFTSNYSINRSKFKISYVNEDDSNNKEIINVIDTINLTAKDRETELLFANDFFITFPYEIIGYTILKHFPIDFLLIRTRWINPSGKMSFLHFVSPLSSLTYNGVDYGYAPSEMIFAIFSPYGTNHKLMIFPGYNLEKTDIFAVENNFSELIKAYPEYVDYDQLIEDWINEQEIPDELQEKLLIPIFMVYPNDQ